MRHIKGFTLIELLIVIAIILILISIALPNFLEAQARAKVAKAAGEIRSLANSQESYYLDWKSYTNDCIGSIPPPHVLGCFQLTTPISYIKQIPFDSFGLQKRTGGTVVNLRGSEVAFYPMGTGINPSTEKKLKGYAPPFTRDTPPKKEAYIIYSAGPSGEEPGNPTTLFPLEADIASRSGGLEAWMIYSPTNGTKSYGGIIRTGGVKLELLQLQNLNKLTHN